MAKAKAKQNATKGSTVENSAMAKAVVKIMQALKASIATLTGAVSATALARKRENDARLNVALDGRKVTDNEEHFRAALSASLNAVYVKGDEAEQKRAKLYVGTLVSKTVALFNGLGKTESKKGRPAIAAQIKDAAKAGLNIDRVTQVARGNATFIKGAFKEVEGSKDSRGGSRSGKSPVAPLKEFENRMILAFTAAGVGKLAPEQVANVLNTVIAESAYKGKLEVSEE